MSNSMEINPGAPEVGSPDEVHRVLTVVWGRDWIIQVVFALLVAVTMAYLLFGRVSISADGNAILIARGTIVPFQATAGGRIANWRVSVGQHVAKGELLATLEQPTVEQDLRLARDQLQEIRLQQQVAQELSSAYLNLERESIKQKRQMLNGRIEFLNLQSQASASMIAPAHEESLAALDKQVQNTEKQLLQERERYDEAVKKLERTLQLSQQGLRTEDQVISDRISLSAQTKNLLALSEQSLQLQLSKFRTNDTFLQERNAVASRQDTIDDLELELNQLNIRASRLERSFEESELSRKLQILDLQRRIDEYEQQIKQESEIHSEFEGKIIELVTSNGMIVARGQRLGTIDNSKGNEELECVCFFRASDAKRIKPGMNSRVLPMSIAQERFGRLKAAVTEVASYPITTDGAHVVVGNQDLARGLLAGGHQVQVILKLSRDSLGNFRSETDSNLAVSSGVLAKAEIFIEEHPPISFVLPIFEKWKGF